MGDHGEPAPVYVVAQTVDKSASQGLVVDVVNQAARGGISMDVGNESGPLFGWDELYEAFGDLAVRVESPSRACVVDPSSPACAMALRDLHNPFFIEDEPGAFQTTGWLDAFQSKPSPYAVAARCADDVAAAVRFARDHGSRLVVKGTGHDYLGRSSAANSLLIWTHHMRDISVHKAFRITGGDGSRLGVPAITVGAGTRWLEAYEAATSQGRYVQGGGCTSVGAAGGFTQGGGFGSFSKRFGTAAGNVLEIEVVTANGEILVANDAQHQDLFWALRGGGGGTFGVVTSMTLRTHDMPKTFGAAIGTIIASSDVEYRHLIREFIVFFGDNLDNEHWGEQIRLAPDNSLELALTMVDLDEAEARAIWKPFTDWISRHSETFSGEIHFATLPFDAMWDLRWWETNVPDFISRDDRSEQSTNLFWWATNQNEVSQYLNAYRSRWLPIELFAPSRADTLVDALFDASRHWHFTLHANKGLSGATAEALERDRTTSINPSTFAAAALLIMASNQQNTHPGVPGHEPDQNKGRAIVRQIDAAMGPIHAITPNAGSYLNETDYFEPDWQHNFWGDNYARLLEIKHTHDPTNLFCVHHGVGSET
jgi:FAD/FMN-containing dehydrogenase